MLFFFNIITFSYWQPYLFSIRVFYTFYSLLVSLHHFYLRSTINSSGMFLTIISVECFQRPLFRIKMADVISPLICLTTTKIFIDIGPTVLIRNANILRGFQLTSESDALMRKNEKTVDSKLCTDKSTIYILIVINITTLFRK